MLRRSKHSKIEVVGPEEKEEEKKKKKKGDKKEEKKKKCAHVNGAQIE